MFKSIVAAGVLWIVALVPAAAAPFVPASDQQVLERLPAGAADPRMREQQALRRRLAAEPGNPELAVQLAQRWFAQVAAEGDPRYIGHAQAALAPWWSQPDAPVPVLVMRAKLRQFNHQFDAALADLAAASARQPDNGEAWAWQAAIHMVQARYVPARQACERMVPLASALVGTGCLASVDSATGRAGPAVAAMRQALTAHPQAPADERLWVLTRLAETEERRGQPTAAEAAFRQALALNLADGYLLAAYADFLLDQGRAPEVLTLLKGMERSDLLLLRLALAAKASGSPMLATWQADLAARFDAARLRGDETHQKEEARFALVLLGQPERALALAGANYQLQREPADARMLLEAAIAARRPAAAEPVLAWMAASGIESAMLRTLAQRLKERA